MILQCHAHLEIISEYKEKECYADSIENLNVMHMIYKVKEDDFLAISEIDYLYT